MATATSFGQGNRSGIKVKRAGFKGEPEARRGNVVGQESLDLDPADRASLERLAVQKEPCASTAT
jgi:hypothetical protein